MSEMKCKNCDVQIYARLPIFYHILSGNRRCDGEPWDSPGNKYPVAEPAIEKQPTPAVEVSGGIVEKCDYVWLSPDRHVCDRIKGHSGLHRCEACPAAAKGETR